MYKTKNDLPESTRAKVIQLLNSRLADWIDLMTQSKQAHWLWFVEATQQNLAPMLCVGRVITPLVWRSRV